MKTWISVLALWSAVSTVALAEFVPDAPFVGEINGSYIDPEFSDVACQVAFQDRLNQLWIGDIDPSSGLFRTSSGRDYLMDTDLPILMYDPEHPDWKYSTNGPEWTRYLGMDWIVYTRFDDHDLMQQWSARLTNGQPLRFRLTNHSEDCYGNMPSRYDDGAPTRLAFTHRWPIYLAQTAWIYVNEPGVFHEIDAHDPLRMSMWSPVSPDFLFIYRPEGAPLGQVARVNADTGILTVLTTDEGEKDDPGMFRAPEYGNEILLVANVDNGALGIYRDLGSPDSAWTRVATLELPPEAPYHYISSPECIAPATGIGGVSYFALLARESADRRSPGSIWIFGLGMDPENSLVRRVDDGAIDSSLAVRMEPEPFFGTDEVYVYYNYYDLQSGVHGLRRARTGLYGPTSDASALAAIPARVALHGIYPNPSSRDFTMALDLPRSGRVRISVFDVAGRRLKTLIEGALRPGRHEVLWQGRDESNQPVHSGLYMVLLQVDDSRETRKITVLR